MSFDSLPEEMILKIGSLLPSDRDFSAFTRTSLRTFSIFAKAGYVWRKRLDRGDLKVSEALRRDGLEAGPLTCPEKEAFYFRSNVERNFRRNRFEMRSVYNADESYFREPHQPNHVDYLDFFVYVHFIASKGSWQVIWFDPLRGNHTQTGVFTRQSRIEETSVRLFVATSNLVVLEFSNGGQNASTSLAGLDLQDNDNPKIVWEVHQDDGIRWLIAVANCQIYRFETNADSVHTIVSMDAKTGQTITTTTTPTEIEDFSQVLNITWRTVSAKVDWLLFMTNMFHVDQEQLWLFDLSTQKFRLLFEVPFGEHVVLCRNSTNDLLATKHLTGESGLISKLWKMPEFELFYQSNHEIKLDENGLAYLIRLERKNDFSFYVEVVFIGKFKIHTLMRIDLNLDEVVRFKPDILFNSLVFLAEKSGSRFEVSITPFAEGTDTLKNPQTFVSPLKVDYDFYELKFFKSKLLFCRWTSFGVLIEVVLLDFTI